MNFQNPHRPQPVSLYSLIKSIIINDQLIIQMIKREVVGRYKGSLLGLTWSLLTPFLMLTIYTFVFSVVFKARWGDDGGDSKMQFALLVFIGMIILGFFTEVVNRSPNLILVNVNYVKKVVFPLEILPVISLGAALFHAAVSFVVLIIALLIIKNHLHLTAIYFPLIFFPMIFLTLGVSWMLASLGVFMRDVGQTIGILTTVLMFMSPVFYPVSALPPRFQVILMLNPLTFIIEQSRKVLIFGQTPDWLPLGIYTLISIIVMWSGYAWFQKTRKGFADVL